VHLGVRQIKAAAQHVAELVVQRHVDRGQRRAGEPGAVERLGARLEVSGSRTTKGRLRASARMPSSAISEVTGLPSLAYRAGSHMCDHGLSPDP
jgi:hypothetical protein